MSRKQALLDALMDGHITPSQRQELDSLADGDPALASQLDGLMQAKLMSEQYRSVSVPQWDPASTFSAQSKPWWQWQGFPLASMACSVFALVLVLTKAQVQVNDKGFSVRFSDAQPELVAKLEDKVSLLETQYTQALQDAVGEIKQEQDLAQAKLAGYMLATSRKERKEDFSELVQFINDQRKDDRRLIAQDFQQALYRSQYQKSNQDADAAEGYFNLDDEE